MISLHLANSLQITSLFPVIASIFSKNSLRSPNDLPAILILHAHSPLLLLGPLTNLPHTVLSQQAKIIRIPSKDFLANRIKSYTGKSPTSINQFKGTVVLEYKLRSLTL